jgi:plasmid replication initiation protein
MATKKALQVVPSDSDYVLQAHAISRSAYKMPIMQRRLLHLAMAHVQIVGEAVETIEMTVGDVVRALGMSDQGNRYEEIRAAAKGLMEHVLDVDTSEGWVMYHWVDKARYIKSRDVIQLKLSDELTPYVLEVKDLWRIIPIRDLSTLQGKHSFRLFELVMADRGFAGKGGNRVNEWFTDLDFGDLRALLKIKPDEYKDTNNFRRKVIDAPIREINEAGMGIRIECDYDKFRRRRQLLGVRLKCRLLKVDEARSVGPATKTELEEIDIQTQYPERYAELLKLELAQPELYGANYAGSPESRAIIALEKELRNPPAPKKRGKAAKKTADETPPPEEVKAVQQAVAKGLRNKHNG